MNEHWAKLIVSHLIQNGVYRFCLSPGSRSTPLAFAVAQEERASALVHFDERGAAFHALGYAKGSREPVAIITTSGSAVGNLFPAVMEAFHERLPLIIITADRPPELQDCGANQTCDQIKLFGSYVQWACDLPCPDSLIPDGYVGSTISQAVFRAKAGPVHLNCHFREPFFGTGAGTSGLATEYEPVHTTVGTATLEKWGKRLSSCERGVIAAGGMLSPSHKEAVYALADLLDWPVLPDVLSGLRSDGVRESVIPYYDAIVKLSSDLHPDCLLQLGEGFISKRIPKAPLHIVVADHLNRLDPTHSVTHRISCNPTLFCHQLLPFISRKSGWRRLWKERSEVIETHLESLSLGLSEPGLIRHLHHHIPPHHALFLANSMPVRDADQFFFPRLFRGPIFGKRGLSGIDGNIAYTTGLSQGTKIPLLALVGDLAALHDCNSFAQEHDHPIIFLVINNGGGGIFSFLPIAEKKTTFERFFAASHNFTFKAAAEMFHLPYYPLNDFSLIGQVAKAGKSCLIELQTNRAENHELHKRIEAELQQCLHSYSSMAF